MRSRWDDHEAARHPGDLGQRVYTSRLLGAEPGLVLHGGGNTSVKCRETDVFGDPDDILWVKGSGWDLATIEAEGFAPVRLERLRRLVTLPALPDVAMARELRGATVDPSAPSPSVEAILHAVLPHRFVDHTHADAVVALTNTPRGHDLVREVYGDRVLLVPYVMPGFELARGCAERLAGEAGGGTVGMVLAGHGIFSFGDTARESYERMIELVTLAEEALRARGAPWPDDPADAPASWAGGGAIGGGSREAGDGTVAVADGRRRRDELAALRREVSAAAGHPVILATAPDEASRAFARHPEVARLSGHGPATPDHVIRTKRVPLVGRDVGAYVEAYRAYFEAHASRSERELTMLDPAPRVVLDAELGTLTAGRTPRDAAVAADIYRHTIRVIMAAEQLGGYAALSERELFDVEYWDLEQAKLARQGAPPSLAGEVALITGAASGIGRACARSLLAEGAAVVGMDLDARVADVAPGPAYRGVEGDVTDPAGVEAALGEAALAFGGLDMLVLNAGVAPPSSPIAELADADWQRAMRVNLDAGMALLRAAHPLLAAAPRSGRVAVVASKNVRAPGPGMAAYSASKAALTQLARVAALEWAADGVRVNVVHPDAVFDTGLWTEDVLEARARHYGMSVEEYKRRNLLGTTVGSDDVAALVVALCGPLFSRTTGAQVPIDGGNERVV